MNNECVYNSLTPGSFCERTIAKPPANSQKKTTTIGLKLWLIITFSTIGAILLVGLMYSRRKLLKSRVERNNSTEHDGKSILTGMQTTQVNDDEAASVASSQPSLPTKTKQHFLSVDAIYR